MNVDLKNCGFSDEQIKTIEDKAEAAGLTPLSLLQERPLVLISDEELSSMVLSSSFFCSVPEYIKLLPANKLGIMASVFFMSAKKEKELRG